MADKRAFAKFDVGYLDNPKMADVLDSSLHAICMHFASVLHCSQHLTDGLVAPKAMQRKVGGSEADIQILIDAGLWHEPDHDCASCRDACPEVPENRVYVHDFLEHNRDAAEAKRVSKERSRVAKEGWEKRKADANGMQIALQSAEQNEPVCNAEREREKERETSSSGIADATPRPEVVELLDLLDDCLQRNGFKKPSRTKKNTDAARLLLEKDGYDKQQVAWMIQWATSDEFWRTNILSMSKLREKFDQLKAKAGVSSKPVGIDFNGQIDVDAILGRDLWQLPAPPEDLPAHEYKAWAVRVRREHDEARYAEAQKRATA